MKASAKTYMTAGVALVGAGVIAASPVTPTPANSEDATRSHEVALMAATQTQREIDAAMALLEGFEPGGAVEAFINGTLEAFNKPGPVPYDPVTGPIDGLSRIGQGFAASGLRLGATALAPLRLIELGQAIADGNGTEGFAALVENIVDAPLWVVDPALYGLRDALPAPLGGPDGVIENFRNQLWKLTEEINAGLQDPGAAVQGFVKQTIEAFERPGPVAYEEVTGPIDGLSRVAEGAIATVLRIATATVLGPVGVVQAAAAFAQGDTDKALAAVENLVDGPLWAVDPALYGLRDALPAPLGGPKAFVENFRNGLWSGTERINGAIRDVVDREATEGRTEFSESPANSVPDENADLVSLSQQEQPKKTEQDSRRLSGLLPKNLVPKQQKQSPARNVLRTSLDFSRGAKTGTQAPTREAGEEDVTVAPPTDTDPAGAGATDAGNDNGDGNTGNDAGGDAGGEKSKGSNTK
jgi:hypothetical protein